MAEIIQSLSLADDPRFAVITDTDEFGFGVFSWHNDEADADHNAIMTGGRKVPVDYKDGEQTEIPGLNRALKRYFGE